MSKTISYKGQIPIGLEERIRLKTLKGKVGYKISKFQIIISDHGTNTYELVAKISKVRDPNIGPTINFTDSNLMAVAYSDSHGDYQNGEIIIFDNEVTNQDVFVNITDAQGGTTPCNYYIEFETMDLSDVEATQLTLKSLRNIASQ
jgi:hypothetical protein